MKQIDRTVLRLLDANLNRAAEGLRVLEECSRMICNHSPLSLKTKGLRHTLAAIVRSEPELDRTILFARDADHDVFNSGATESETTRTDIPSLVRANAKRVAEAVRALEEYGKLVSPDLAVRFKKVRFEVYSLEQKLVVMIARRDLSGSGRFRLGYACDLEKNGKRLPEVVSRLADSGAGFIIACRGSMADRAYAESAAELVDLCSGAGILAIIEHRLDIALVSGAEGMILGADDISPLRCRRSACLPFIIGYRLKAADRVQAAERDAIDLFIVEYDDLRIAEGAFNELSGEAGNLVLLNGIEKPEQLNAIDSSRVHGIVLSSGVGLESIRLSFLPFVQTLHR